MNRLKRERPLKGQSELVAGLFSSAAQIHLVRPPMTSEPGPGPGWNPEQIVRLHGYGEMPLRSAVATVMTLEEDDRTEATIFRDQQPLCV